MKSIHFCTPKKLLEIKQNDEFKSIRTGWIPQLYPNDIIKINERDTKGNDSFLFKAQIVSVVPVLYKNLDYGQNKEEIIRYHKKFNPEQYFFTLHFQKIKQKTLEGLV